LIIQPYLWVVTTAGLVGLAVGTAWGGADLTPGWAAFGWLVLTAVLGQSIGWLLVALASPRLSSTVSAALLLLTPVGALLLSAAATGEKPSLVQLVGAVMVLAGAYQVARGHAPERATRST
jgi:drug/metabolite transporter (DMT)-like permease